MRPKRVILCVDSDKNALGALSFMLATNGYRVIKASSAAIALHHFLAEQIDLTVVRHSADIDGIELILQLQAIRKHELTILLAPDGIGCETLHCLSLCANVVIEQKSYTAAGLLERIKVMSVRRRGPAKGTPHPAAKEAPGG